MNKIFNEYSHIGDDFFYHHTVSEPQEGEHYRGPEMHRQHEVIYLIEGHITYVIEGEIYEVTPGDMLLVRPGEIHTLIIYGTLPYERAVLLFNMEPIERMLRDTGVDLYRLSDEFTGRMRLIGASTVREYGLSALLMDIVHSDEPEPYNRMRVLSRLLDFISSLHRLANSDGHRASPPLRVDPLVNRTIEYIDAHLCERFSLEDICRELFVSKSTLCHHFSDCMHISPGRYIAIKKMHRADELMQSGISASEASRMVGYENYTSFYYNFKQIMGVSPGLAR